MFKTIPIAMTLIVGAAAGVAHASDSETKLKIAADTFFREHSLRPMSAVTGAPAHQAYMLAKPGGLTAAAPDGVLAATVSDSTRTYPLLPFGILNNKVVLTAMVFQNVTDASGQVVAEFFDRDGRRMSVPIYNGMTQSEWVGVTDSLPRRAAGALAAISDKQFEPAWMRVRSQPEGAIGVTLFYMTADLENNDMVIHSVVAPTSNKETETNFAYIATKENIWLSLVNDTAAAQSYTILFRDETGREACRSTGILAAQEQLFEKVSRILPCSVGIAGLVQANSRTGLAANLYLEGEKTAFLVQSGLQAVR